MLLTGAFLKETNLLKRSNGNTKSFTLDKHHIDLHDHDDEPIDM